VLQGADDVHPRGLYEKIYNKLADYGKESGRSVDGDYG
jgi:hypothetical protein